MNKIKALLAFFTAFISLNGVAQTFDKSKLDSYFDTLELHDKFMGSVAVSQNGTIIYTKAIGYADVDNNIKADDKSRYRIGSISKMFTAVLVFMAVEEGKLNLSQTIDTYFPTIKNADKITIDLLLHHRSGIYNITNSPDYRTWNTEPKSEQEMVKKISDAGSVFAPDSTAEYSNSNFMLLSYILEKSCNKPYSELLEQKICTPLHLKDTYFGGKINTQNRECLSYSYLQKRKLETETETSIPLGAGGIVSTPSDLVKFIHALFDGKLITKEHLELMKDIKDRYGRGMKLFPFNDHKGYGHTGGIDGFLSMLVYFPDENISFAFTSNGTNFNVNNITTAVLSAVYGKDYEIPRFTVINLTPEELNQYVGVYSSSQLPLKLTITSDGKMLSAQGTGQSAFPLEPSEKDVFKFDMIGIVIEFHPTEKTLTLKQSGDIFLFTKEENE